MHWWLLLEVGLKFKINAWFCLKELEFQFMILGDQREIFQGKYEFIHPVLTNLFLCLPALIKAYLSNRK